MFWQGAYFLHHQMSGFRTQGSFVVDESGHPVQRSGPAGWGLYAFEMTAHGLRFDVIDDCPWSGARR